MAFSSADAMGFLLELDDQLSPGLAKAGKNYAKFTRDLDRLNKKAYTSVNKTFRAMAQMVDMLNKDLPKAVAKATQRMGGVGGSGRVPKMNVNVTLKGGRGLEKEIANAVLSGVRTAQRRMPRNAMTRAGSGPLPPMSVKDAMPRKFDIRSYQARRNAEIAADLSMRGNRGWVKNSPGLQAFQGALNNARKADTRGSGAARQSLLESFASLSPNERKKVQKDYTNMMQTLRKTRDHIREADKSSTLMGRTMGFMSRGWTSVSNTVRGMASSAREVSRNTRFMALVTALDRFSGLFRGGHEFFQGMNDLNRELHLSRAELAEMSKAGIGIADKYGGLLDPNQVKDAMTSLARFGARARTEFEKLAPTVALATQAMNMSGDTAAQLARKLGTKYKMSKTGVADVFANISRIGGATGVSGEDLARSMISNTEAGGAFLSGLSPEGRQSVLTNMASLQGVLTKNFGDSGNRMGTMIAEALSDATSDSARNIANLTGLTGGSKGSLGAALQRGDLSMIMGNMARRGAQAGGNATVASQMAASMGISGEDLLRFASNSEDMQRDLQGLASSTIAAGTGFQRLAEDAGKSLSDLDKIKNKFKTTLSNMLPAWMLQGMSELSTSGTGLAAGGFLAGAGARYLGKMPLIGGLLRSIPGIGGLFGSKAAATATKTAGAGIMSRAATGLTKGATGSFATGLLGPLAMALTPSTMGAAEESPAQALARQQQEASRTSMSFTDLALREANRLYSSQGTMTDMWEGTKNLFGFGSGTDPRMAFMKQAEANVHKVYGISPGDSVPISQLSNFESKMATGLMTKEQLAAAEKAKREMEAAAASNMQSYMMMSRVPGFTMSVTPPANGTGAPRPLPPDTVTRSIAEGRH